MTPTDYRRLAQTALLAIATKGRLTQAEQSAIEKSAPAIWGSKRARRLKAAMFFSNCLCTRALVLSLTVPPKKAWG